MLANTNQQIEVFDCQKKWSFKTIFRSSYSKKLFNLLNPLLALQKLKCRSKRWSHDKIPLSKPVSITNQWLQTTIDEVLILLPLNQKPYIMLYDDENNPHFYYVKGDPKGLLKK